MPAAVEPELEGVSVACLAATVAASSGVGGESAIAVVEAMRGRAHSKISSRAVTTNGPRTALSLSVLACFLIGRDALCATSKRLSLCPYRSCCDPEFFCICYAIGAVSMNVVQISYSSEVSSAKAPRTTTCWPERVMRTSGQTTSCALHSHTEQ